MTSAGAGIPVEVCDEPAADVDGACRCVLPRLHDGPHANQRGDVTWTEPMRTRAGAGAGIPPTPDGERESEVRGKRVSDGLYGDMEGSRAPDPSRRAARLKPHRCADGCSDDCAAMCRLMRVEAERDALRARLDQMGEALPVVECPSCGASIRARMADRDGETSVERGRLCSGIVFPADGSPRGLKAAADRFGKPITDVQRTVYRGPWVPVSGDGKDGDET